MGTRQGVKNVLFYGKYVLRYNMLLCFLYSFLVKHDFELIGLPFLCMDTFFLASPVV